MDIIEEKTIPLRKPIKLGELSYDKITLREPTAGELAKATNAGNNVEVAISLISLIGAIPKTAVEKMCQRDLQECNDFLGSFALAGPTTGESS